MITHKFKLLIPMSLVAMAIIIILIGQMRDNIEKETTINKLSVELQKIHSELEEQSIQLEAVKNTKNSLETKINDFKSLQDAVASSLEETSSIIRNDIEDVEIEHDIPSETRRELNRIRRDLTSQIMILTRNLEGILNEDKLDDASFNISFFNSAYANDEILTGGNSFSKYHLAIVSLVMLGIALLASLGAAFLSNNEDKRKSGEKMSYAIISFLIGGFTGHKL